MFSKVVALVGVGVAVWGCGGAALNRPDGGGCVPTSCAAQGKSCGALSDGCGGTLECGGCTDPETCGGSGVENVCGAAEWGTTYYVRIDGGDAAQCTGLADAPYPGAGSAQACGWSHPFVALPPGGAPRLAGGDRLIIGPGSYRMGVGAPGAEGCDPGGSWDCRMPPVPSGPDAGHATRIVGAGHQTGCADPPELWGAERADVIVDLTGTDHARIECLELTDHSGCVEFHSGSLACERDSPPYGDWAATGLAASDSDGVTLRRLDIHGLASAGVRAGRLKDWVVEDVRIAANGWVGWDGDIDGDDANTGTLRFRRWTVEWNGCGETWPEGEPAGCWAQTAGGYGDGVGTGGTGGDWIIEDSVFQYNTSDGLDLLYHRLGGTITIDRVIARGNAGNQLKTTGDAVIRNSLVVGDCGFFQGKPFTYAVDDCRAAGNAVSLDLGPGDAVVLANNTVYSEGDCVLLAGGDTCNGSETLVSRNNVYLGGVDYLQPFERSCFFYTECAGLAIDASYDVVFAVKDAECPPGGQNLCVDPLLVSGDPATFDAHLGAGSPARDSGLPVGDPIPAVDLAGNPRPAGAAVDRGAYEMQN